MKIVKIGRADYQLFDLKADTVEEHDLFSERPNDAKRQRVALDRMVASVTNSQAGADYPEGKVTREGPHGRFWYAIPEYQPFLKGWASRPEYSNWVNRKQRTKKNAAEK
ncbi:MAG: hypothetical protein P8J37_05860 [Fuerstiella sp.]|nr:hypothetical protein [Fuerstiella sp.]